MLVCLHIYTNFKAMRSLHMRTLNRPRLLQILSVYARELGIPEVGVTNEKEPLFSGPAFIQNYLSENYKLEGGVSIHYVSRHFSETREQFSQFLFKQMQHFEDFKYMLFLDSKSRKFFILYHEYATETNIIESFLAAHLCAINLSQEKDEFIQELKIEDYSNSLELIFRCKNLAKQSIETFSTKLLEKGWLIAPLRLNIGDWKLGSKKFL